MGVTNTPQLQWPPVALVGEHWTLNIVLTHRGCDVHLCIDMGGQDVSLCTFHIFLNKARGISNRTSGLVKC